MNKLVISTIPIFVIMMAGNVCASGISYSVKAPFYNDDLSDVPGIIISSQIATSADIEAAINDPLLFNKIGSTVTLLTNLLVKWDSGVLKIENEKWILGATCYIEVQGELVVTNSELTSSDHALSSRGRIIMQSYYGGPSRWDPNYGWKFEMTNSKLYYIGFIGTGQDVYGGPRETPLFIGNEVFHCTNTPSIGGFIVNNWFHDNVQKLSAPGTEAADSDGNGLITIGVTKGAGLFDGNLIENSAVNYLSISWGSRATISNNIYRNIGAIPGGEVFRQKEGDKGTFIRNNLFHNGQGFAGYNGIGGNSVANPAILYSASTHNEWGNVSNNIIHHWPGKAILINGNGYLGQFSVMSEIMGNFLFLNNIGISMEEIGYFGSGWPVDITIRNNNLFDSASITGDAVNFVHDGNFIDGIFWDNAPDNIVESPLRITLAPAAVWTGGRVSTITVAVASLEPLTSISLKVKSPDGIEWPVSLVPISETTYPYDYLAEFETAGLSKGEGLVIMTAVDNFGNSHQQNAAYYVREMISKTNMSAYTTPPVISNLQIKDITDSSAVVTWQTDKICDSWAKFSATGGNYPGQIFKSELTTAHSLILQNLHSDVNYSVVLNSRDIYGNPAQSNGISFRTNAPNTLSSNGSVLVVYPNPYVKGKSTGNKIVFGNLPKESVLRIYTVSGVLVKTIKHEESVDGAGEEWDISDISGGVYLYNIVSSQGTTKGKVSIIK